VPFTLTEAITLAVASVGAVLGVINTWHLVDQRRVKLKVIPKRAMPIGAIRDSGDRLCIEVTNLSSFPITVAEVGVFYRGTDVRGAIIQPIFLDGGTLPRRLESRASLTAYAADAFPGGRDRHVVKCAYARTDCGVVATGNSPALRAMASQ